MMFDLPSRYLQVQAEAAELAASVEPIAATADSSSEVHTGMLSALRESALCQLIVPAMYGGRFKKVDPLAICVARERLIPTSSQLDSLFALQQASHPITVAGCTQVKETWLPRVAKGAALCGLAITEEHAGSDVRSITTSLSRREGTLVIRGKKTFISNAAVASVFVVLARDGDSYSLVIVPRAAEGVATSSGPEVISPHNLGDITFDDAVVPPSALLGRGGDGLEIMLSTLALFRVTVAGAAVGLAQVALEEAARHAGTRKQFGRPIVRHGQVAQLLADSWTELESVRLLTYRAAVHARNDPLAVVDECSMAKLAATEAASRITDNAVQILGRWGVVKDSKVERLFRHARLLRIYEGTSEILRLGIARALCEAVL